MVPRAKSVLTALLLLGLCLAALPAVASQKPRSHSKAARPKVEAPAPVPPAPPPTPAQLPPNPPQVSFRDGLLTVSAQNSTLADILAAVRAQTGATIDLPAGTGSERVFFQRGPAPVHDVLVALLQGSRFDYIILGPPGRPGDVQRVLLLVKPAGPEPAAAAGAAPPPPAPAAANPNPDLEEGDEGAVPEETEPQPLPPQPETVQPAPAQPKTPEQLLEELRQQQQRMQQQQQQQQQNPPPPPPDTEPQ